MSMFCLTKLALLFMVFAVSAENPAKAPAPAADCDQQLMSLAVCVTYVMIGSKMTEPDGNCCKGLITVLATTNGPMCLCGSLDKTGLQGVQVNGSRALSLPNDCSITNYPSAAQCSSMKKPGVPPSSTVVKNPPAAVGTAASPGSSASSSIVRSVKLLIRTAAATAVLFIY